jgi:hypothetical protein
LRSQTGPERTRLGLPVEPLNLRQTDAQLCAQSAEPFLQTLPDARIEHLFADLLKHGRETGLASGDQLRQVVGKFVEGRVKSLIDDAGCRLGLFLHIQKKGSNPVARLARTKQDCDGLVGELIEVLLLLCRDHNRLSVGQRLLPVVGQYTDLTLQCGRLLHVPFERRVERSGGPCIGLVPLDLRQIFGAREK